MYSWHASYVHVLSTYIRHCYCFYTFQFYFIAIVANGHGSGDFCSHNESCNLKSKVRRIVRMMFVSNVTVFKSKFYGNSSWSEARWSSDFALDGSVVWWLYSFMFILYYICNLWIDYENHDWAWWVKYTIPYYTIFKINSKSSQTPK